MTQAPVQTSSNDLSGRQRAMKWRGFTLVEILLVMVVISILAGAMVVSLSGQTDKYALRVSADDLANALRYASSNADLHARSTSVLFSNDLHGFQVVTTSERENESANPVAGLPGRLRRFPAGVELVDIVGQDEAHDACQVELAFRPGGGFAGRVILQNRLGEQLIVEVLPQTGQVLTYAP